VERGIGKTFTQHFAGDLILLVVYLFFYAESGQFVQFVTRKGRLLQPVLPRCVLNCATWKRTRKHTAHRRNSLILHCSGSHVHSADYEVYSPVKLIAETFRRTTR
jgi:hypothetical protein